MPGSNRRTARHRSKKAHRRGRKRAPARVAATSLRFVLEFLRTGAGGGGLLILTSVLAIAWANTPLSSTYDALWHTHPAGSPLDLRELINEGLMAAFFLLVGLEIKRELVSGELSELKAAALPLIAAIGGMVLPAIIFLALAPEGARRGWAIPMATDIAFAAAVLAVLGRRVPNSLKVFLLSLAVADDIGALIVIAVFYAEGVSPAWLLLPLFAVGSIVLAGRRVSHKWLYFALTAIAWYGLYRAHIPPAIAGAAAGLAVPNSSVGDTDLLHDLERKLNPLVSYAILPLFAFANAGVSLSGSSGSAATALAVAAGLVVGKMVGISGSAALAVKLRLARLPSGVTPLDIIGVSAICGIGFTVSLFVAQLSFGGSLLEASKLGVLGGSLASGTLGLLITAFSGRRRRGSSEI